MNTAAKRKRIELSTFIQREVITEPSVQGLVAIGSVATGMARADSDIDAVVFLEPFDLYAIPAEFQWQPDQCTFHGISGEVENAIQFDFKRLDLMKWSMPTHVWPEPICAELGEGWLAFDRNDQIYQLVAERTKFSDEIRQLRLDEAFVQLDQLLNVSKSERTWATLGSSMAHVRLHSAYDYLIQAIFAYNRRWRTWRSRELSYLIKLPWLPERFEEQVLLATNALSVTQDGYQQRLTILRHFFDELVVKCQQDRLYGLNVVDEAFIRQNDEPGRDWNMEEWIRSHRQRRNTHSMT
jgi:hypothetical protein